MKKVMTVLLALIMCVGTVLLVACNNCDHDYDKDGMCIKCGQECKHEYPDGMICKICGKSNPDYEPVDYVAQCKFNPDSERSWFVATSVYNYVDGDTTHFKIPSDYTEYRGDGNDGIFKARYLAVNTPESTFTIDDYGKTASRFTKEKLSSAKSIIIESDTSGWAYSSDMSRVLAWVWYKPSDDADYRNLNLELLQEGWGRGSNASQNSYGTYCSSALSQATTLKRGLFCGTPDPEVYRGDAIETTLAKLRLYPDEYNNKKIAVTGVVAVRQDRTTMYIEDYDSEQDIAFGVSIFLGYSAPSAVNNAMQVGNRVLVVGTFQLSDKGYAPQITDVQYNVRDKNDPENTRLIEKNQEVYYKEMSITEFFGDATYNVMSVPESEDDTPQIIETITEKNAYLRWVSGVILKNIQVEEVFTTKSGSNKGSISITGKVDGQTITVRTVLLKKNGATVTEDVFVGKTIDVKGLVDYYPDKGIYQIKLFSIDDVTFHE